MSTNTPPEDEVAREKAAQRQRTQLNNPHRMLLLIRYRFVQAGGSGRAFDWAVNAYVQDQMKAATTTTPTGTEISAVEKKTTAHVTIDHTQDREYDALAELPKAAVIDLTGPPRDLDPLRILRDTSQGLERAEVSAAKDLVMLALQKVVEEAGEEFDTIELADSIVEDLLKNGALIPEWMPMPLQGGQPAQGYPPSAEQLEAWHGRQQISTP